MIIVDTSVWIDHLHSAEPELQDLLANDRVATHEAIIEELALGSIRQRDEVIGLLGRLHRVPRLRHDELVLLVHRARLWGSGLSAVDAHLLGSALLAESAIWTRDKHLHTTAGEIGVGIFEAERRRAPQ